jgi:hypothetical protein
MLFFSPRIGPETNYENRETFLEKGEEVVSWQSEQ